MITTIIIYSVAYVMGKIAEWLPTNDAMPAGITSALSWVFGSIYMWNELLNVDAILICLSLMLSVVGVFAVFRAVVWLINMWRGTNL